MSEDDVGYRDVFEKADVGIALNDPGAGTVGRVNERYAELVGYDKAELRDMPISEITGDDPAFDQEQAMERLDRAMDGDPQQFDWLVERADGSQFWAGLSIKRATVGGEDRLMAFLRDVSDRRREAREREKFREVYEKADEAIGLTDPETGEIMEVNPKYAEILGYDREELPGMSIADVSANSSEFSQEDALSVVRDAMDGEARTLDWQLKRKDGSTVWAAVSLKRARIGDEDRLLVFFRDVAERKAQEAELERHRREMEFFNSLLRHDVLNAVTVIRTHGARLASTLDGEQRDHAETVVEWSDNVAGVVERVRTVLETLTGEGDPSFRPVDLPATLQGEIDRLQGAYPAVGVEADLPDDVQVAADDLLGDVFGNLLTNAVDHNGAEGLTISVSVDPGPDAATVVVADDGCGVPDGDKEAVFRRGKTGHVKKTGSGFGLFFVDSMVDAYGGDVRVEDNEPSGARFVLDLPTPAESA